MIQHTCKECHFFVPTPKVNRAGIPIVGEIDEKKPGDCVESPPELFVFFTRDGARAYDSQDRQVMASRRACSRFKDGTLVT